MDKTITIIFSFGLLIFLLSEAYSAKMTSFVLKPIIIGDPQSIDVFLLNTNVKIAGFKYFNPDRIPFEDKIRKRLEPK